VIAALAAVQRSDPGLEISVTFGSGLDGPDANGRSMIDQAASLGFQPYAWTIMPFDFGSPVADMGNASITAAEGLDADLAAAYHLSTATAFRHVGISSMNGTTDESDETVTTTDFTAIVAFAQTDHLARVTFWSVNRDRPCTGGSPASDSCSGIAQQPLAFTSILSRFHG
jgi:chitinase